jgi:hypothetical protein
MNDESSRVAVFIIHHSSFIITPAGNLERSEYNRPQVPLDLDST